MRILHQREVPADTTLCRRQRRRRAPVRSIIDWLRSGYPDEAPRTGYSPLLALNGPIALSARQTQQIVAELGEGPTDSIDIGVTITKATNHLPTQAQTRAVTRALR
jgi:Protein of unknown function (DUF3349)